MTVKVTPNARDNLVIPIEDDFRVRVTAPAGKGQANAKVIELISEYFKVPKSKVEIISGWNFREKIVKIETDEDK
ncbi:hypothetical protein A2Y26_03880 [candidate division CPR2 bacterium GWD2_39_7]|nr:MAG: hypothetical protein A2Y26_03880 [candidate division CPR2 bacterium GWD2_39_7]